MKDRSVCVQMAVGLCYWAGAQRIRQPRSGVEAVPLLPVFQMSAQGQGAWGQGARGQGVSVAPASSGGKEDQN